jgi:hypothetical protein
VSAEVEIALLAVRRVRQVGQQTRRVPGQRLAALFCRTLLFIRADKSHRFLLFIQAVPFLIFRLVSKMKQVGLSASLSSRPKWPVVENRPAFTDCNMAAMRTLEVIAVLVEVKIRQKWVWLSYLLIRFVHGGECHWGNQAKVFSIWWFYRLAWCGLRYMFAGYMFHELAVCCWRVTMLWGCVYIETVGCRT